MALRLFLDAKNQKEKTLLTQDITLSHYAEIKNKNIIYSG